MKVRFYTSQRPLDGPLGRYSTFQQTLHALGNSARSTRHCRLPKHAVLTPSRTKLGSTMAVHGQANWPIYSSWPCYHVLHARRGVTPPELELSRGQDIGRAPGMTLKYASPPTSSPCRGPDWMSHGHARVRGLKWFAPWGLFRSHIDNE